MYFIVRLWKFFDPIAIGYYIPQIIHNHFTDFLCMPIVLFMCLALIRWIKRDANLVFSLPMIVTMVIYYSLIFEVFLPRFGSDFTGDWLDVVAYVMGGVFYYWIQWYIEARRKLYVIER